MKRGLIGNLWNLRKSKWMSEVSGGDCRKGPYWAIGSLGVHYWLGPLLFSQNTTSLHRHYFHLGRCFKILFFSPLLHTYINSSFLHYKNSIINDPTSNSFPTTNQEYRLTFWCNIWTKVNPYRGCKHTFSYAFSTKSLCYVLD